MFKARGRIILHFELHQPFRISSYVILFNLCFVIKIQICTRSWFSFRLSISNQHAASIINDVHTCSNHYNDVIISAMASQITSITIVYSIVYLDADQRKHQSSASLAFVRGIHRWPVNSPHNWPVTRKMFPFDNVIMDLQTTRCTIGTVVSLFTS